MKALSKSEKILIAILLITVIGYVYFQYIFTPVSTKVLSAQSNVDKLEQELLQSRLMAASNKKMTEEINTLKVNYEKYLKLMPKSDMSAEIIREVNRLAADNKVTLNSLTLGIGAEYKLPTEAVNATAANQTNAAAQNTGAKASTAKVMAVPVAINIHGDYNSFTSFINSLENSNRLTNINSVNVAKSETEATGDKLTVTLNASMLYVQDGTVAENKYDFNNGSYSKVNPFK
jgi:Tfp pilus assembly protein PilO